MDPSARLTQAVAAICPVIGVSISAPSAAGVRIVFDPAATQAQQASAQAVVASFDWSDAAQLAWQNLQDRAAAKAVFASNTDAAAKILRATALVLLDQVNTIRAALPTPLPAITVAQARTAIQNKIDNGAAD
jgi:hypothetical protein